VRRRRSERRLPRRLGGCAAVVVLLAVGVEGTAASAADFPPPASALVSTLLGVCGLLLRRNVKRFRGGLVLKADRWLYHSTLGSRVIKKKKKYCGECR